MSTGLIAIDDIGIADNDSGEWEIIEEGDPRFVYSYPLKSTAVAVKKGINPEFLPVHVNPSANFWNVRSVTAINVVPLGYQYSIWQGEYGLYSKYLEYLWKGAKLSIAGTASFLRNVIR